MTLDNIKSNSLLQSYEKILNEIYSQLSTQRKIKMSMESIFNFGEELLFFSLNQKISVDEEYFLDW